MRSVALLQCRFGQAKLQGLGHHCLREERLTTSSSNRKCLSLALQQTVPTHCACRATNLGQIPLLEDALLLAWLLARSSQSPVQRRSSLVAPCPAVVEAGPGTPAAAPRLQECIHARPSCSMPMPLKDSSGPRPLPPLKCAGRELLGWHSPRRRCGLPPTDAQDGRGQED